MSEAIIILCDDERKNKLKILQKKTNMIKI